MAWCSAIESVENIIQEITECNRFIIWGGGAHTEYVYQTTSFFHIFCQSEFIVIDSDPIKHGKTWRGIPIFPPSVIKGLDWISTNLLISSYGGQDSIIEEACKLGVPENNIIKLYKTIRRY